MLKIRKPQSNYNQGINPLGRGVQGTGSARRGCRNALWGRLITAPPRNDFLFNFDLSAKLING